MRRLTEWARGRSFWQQHIHRRRSRVDQHAVLLVRARHARRLAMGGGTFGPSRAMRLVARAYLTEARALRQGEYRRLP